MKKLIALPLMLAFSTPAFSDFLLGVYGGAGVWNAGIDGEVGVGESPVTSDELGLDDENNNVFYIAIEHFVPIIPNVKLQHTGISIKGSGTVARGFTLDDVTFSANADTVTEIDFTHTDLTMYYEILDNWVSLDVGLTARKMDGFAQITATYPDLPPENDEVDLDVTLPMLYGKAQFDLPFSGWYLGGTINYISISDNTFSDVEAKVGYLTDGLGLDFGFELGFRQLNLVAEADDDLNADITIDGPYAEVIFHF